MRYDPKEESYRIDDDIYLNEFIAKLEKIRDEDKNKKYIVEIEEDYTGCYYEGDRPEIYISVRPCKS